MRQACRPTFVGFAQDKKPPSSPRTRGSMDVVLSPVAERRAKSLVARLRRHDGVECLPQLEAKPTLFVPGKANVHGPRLRGAFSGRMSAHPATCAPFAQSTTRTSDETPQR